MIREQGSFAVGGPVTTKLWVQGTGILDKKESISLLRATVERGVTLFDTAEMYGPFTDEELAGKALKAYRHSVVIATKFGIKLQDGKQVQDSVHHKSDNP
jgi:aryl-alcohol dehydrogenase-like predicted oxidoreductase